MNMNSKKTTLITLGLTAIVLSRAMFAFFNDPEGPNLLVVAVMALIVYALTFGVYFFYPQKQESLKKLSVLILVQILIVAGLYFGLK